MPVFFEHTEGCGEKNMPARAYAHHDEAVWEMKHGEAPGQYCAHAAGSLTFVFMSGCIRASHRNIRLPRLLSGICWSLSWFLGSCHVTITPKKYMLVPRGYSTV